MKLTHYDASGIVKLSITTTSITTVTDGDYGDISVSGVGTIFTIDDEAVTYAKIQNVSATDRILGRATAGAGPVEEIACTAAGRALIDDANAAAQLTTLGGGAPTGTGVVVLANSPTVVTPTIASFLNAQHDHLDAAGGGLLDAAVIDTGTINVDRLGSGAVGAGSKALFDDNTWQTIAGGGDALTSDGLDQFAATTSAELRGVLSDETGTGLAVFNDTPTLSTPVLLIPVIANFTSAQHDHLDADDGGTLDAAAIASGTIGHARLGSGGGGSSKFLREDSTYQTITAGDALTSGTLAQFAATSSAQLRGVLNDETGTGLAYFQGGDIGTPSAGVATNLTGTAAGLTAGTASAVAVGGITGLGSGVATLLATPSADNLFAAITGAAPRLAYWIRQAAARTLANSGSGQVLFDSVTNGTLTLPVGVYKFEFGLYITSMSGTSGNAAINIVGTGSATCDDRVWHAVGLDANTPTTAAAQTGSFCILNSASPVVVAANGTSLGVTARGMFEVTVAGTLIPSITLATAVGTASLAAGSYWIVEYFGGTGAVSAGPWT